MKEKVLELIKNRGVDKTAQIFGKSVLDLYKDFKLPITDGTISNQLAIEIMNQPEYDKRYEEYDIFYDNFENIIEWSDENYSNNVGEDISMLFYCTPFYDGSNTVPIQLGEVNKFMGGSDYDNVSDYFSDDYMDVIDLSNTKFNTVDELIDWLNNDYKELVYNILTRLRNEIFENELEKDN